jgi:hypothetical protein
MSKESELESTENAQELEKKRLEPESDGSLPAISEPFVDQEMADAYGFTPQQAKAMSMYL